MTTGPAKTVAATTGPHHLLPPDRRAEDAAAGDAGDAAVPIDGIDDLLLLAREQLGMQVAFLGRFEGEDRVIRNVSTAVPLPVDAVLREPRELTHCQRIVDGRMGRVTPDTAASPAAQEPPATAALGIRSYVGVPVHRSDGSLYGTLCCLSFEPDESLRPRDAGVLAVLARAVGSLAEREERVEGRRRELLGRLASLREAGGLEPVFQPLVEVTTGRTVGVEALSRFPRQLGGTPAQWFAAAAEVGAGVELELEAVAKAVDALERVSGYVSVNASPAGILDRRFRPLLAGLPLHRVVVEVTEHQPVEDYARLTAALDPLRRAGLRLAVDDTGAGYASMSHVLALLPDMIKLDRVLVRGIDTDAARQALVGALLAFAGCTGATVVAEGVETGPELATLRRLGVPLAQGYLLGRPAPLPPRG
jgi:EAL domain-containing protein (putative c-di-GMP-specific phosphodiesterase class I)